MAITIGGSGVVAVSAAHEVSGNWGNGGDLYTTDGGRSWSKNEKLPFESSLFSSTPDPNHGGKGFFLFFGGGMLYGPWPTASAPLTVRLY
jgi:hypothetical protein